MANIKVSMENAWETELTSEFGPSDLTAIVASTGTLTSPCRVVIDPYNSNAGASGGREYVLFDGTFTSTNFVTTNIANRYQPGSYAPSNLTHPVGTKVRISPEAGHFLDLHDRVDAVAAAAITDHGAMAGLADNDHPQYLLSSGFTKVTVDALGVDAVTLNGGVVDAVNQGVYNAIGTQLPEGGTFTVLDTLDLSGQPAGSEWVIQWNGRIRTGNTQLHILSIDVLNVSGVVIDSVTGRRQSYAKDTYAEGVELTGSQRWVVGTGNPGHIYGSDQFQIRTTTTVFDQTLNGGIRGNGWFTAIRVA